MVQVATIPVAQNVPDLGYRVVPDIFTLPEGMNLGPCSAVAVIAPAPLSIVAADTAIGTLSGSGILPDLVVCLDVLEHLPEPPEIVSKFADWLRPGGFVITHSPFFFVEQYQPTHLASNLKYSGDTRFFEKAGLHPYAGRFFWDPIVFQKADAPSPRRRTTALRLGQGLLWTGRLLYPIHSRVARFLSRGDRTWSRELRAMLNDAAGNEIDIGNAAA